MKLKGKRGNKMKENKKKKSIKYKKICRNNAC